jgi:energy-converting hydrogenase Eha subunit H
MRDGIQIIAEKASARGVHISPDELASRSLIAPVCGLGSTTVEIAEQVFNVTAETSAILKQG